MQTRLRWYFIVPALILIGLFVWFFKNLIIYFIIAAIVSLMGRPIIKLFRRIRVKNLQFPDALSALLTLLFIYGLALSFFLLMIPLVIQQAESISNINEEIVTSSMRDPIESLDEFAHTHGLLEKNESIRTYLQDKLRSVVSFTRLSNLANNIIGFTGDFFIAVFSISFIAFFFLKDPKMLHSIIISMIPANYEERAEKVLTGVKTLLTRYFIGVVIEVLLVGGLIATGLSILGVKNALMIGFFAGLFNVIPYVGPLIGAGLGMTLTALGSLNGLSLDFYSQMIPLMLKVGVVFLIVQLIDNFVFQPFIYSSSVKAHPLEIFLIILMAGSIAGVGGMILAIPVYTIFRVMAKEFFNQFKLVQSITKGI